MSLMLDTAMNTHTTVAMYPTTVTTTVTFTCKLTLFIYLSIHIAVILPSFNNQNATGFQFYT